MTSNLSLDDDQRFALIKFRRSVQDVLEPHHDDYFLVRWLRARAWNSDAAEKMLRTSLKWRQQWQVDGELRNWKRPEHLTQYYPYGTSGVDPSGAPIIVVPYAGLDVYGILHCFTRQDMLRMTIQIIEENLEAANKSGSKQVIVIVDMDNFSLRPYTWRPAAELVISLIQLYESNYPEILKAAYVINAPSVFAIAFNIVKKFMNEITISKIQIFKHDPKKWKKVLVEQLGADSIPMFYGGNLCDPDGNPRYTTKVCQGGKIPKSMYLKNSQQADDQVLKPEDFITTTIKKGDKLVLEFDVVEEGCFLHWNFRTEGHDIRFGITQKDSDGQVSPVVRFNRVASHQIDEIGVMPCQAPSSYIVTFDNTYSMMRSKKIRYYVHVTLPLEKLGVFPTPEELKDINQKDIKELDAEKTTN